MITDEAWKALTIIVPSTTTIVAGLFYRMWSRTEHKGSRQAERETAKNIKEIYVLMNGEIQKKIQEAYEKGRKDERQKQE